MLTLHIETRIQCTKSWQHSRWLARRK